MAKHTQFQYCPKIVLFSKDETKVLLAKRRGEQDYDGTFSFIGGKSETTDESLLSALKREKDEEIGPEARVAICWQVSCYQVLFQKKDGNSVVLPHHVARFVGGEIKLNRKEYDECRWVALNDLEHLEPKIENIPLAVKHAKRFLQVLDAQDFEEI